MTDPSVIASLAELTFAFDSFALFIFALLVLLMQPGFAMLEAGLHSAKNVVNILMKNFSDLAIAGIFYWAIGFSIMYGTGLFLRGYENESFAVGADFFFQLVFAATAATIVGGAIGGRAKFAGYLVFSALMTAIVYPYLGSWKWGGGWLDQRGFQDFAGSSVVHAVGGFAALGAVLVLGPRLGKYVGGRSRAIPGSSMPLAGLGVFFLWIGWFGFNPGSQLAFSTRADIEAVANVFLNTNLAAVGGALAALITSWVLFKKSDFSMTINGVLAGLVSITAGPDVINGFWAVVVGAIGGVIVVLAVLAFDRAGIDDPVGAISVHGVCGIWGTIAVGIFGGANLGIQILGTLSYSVAALAAGAAIFAILRGLGLARVSSREEVIGLDISEHGAAGYVTGEPLSDPVIVASGD